MLRRSAFVVPVVLGLLLTGCGGGEDEPADPSSSASASAEAPTGDEPTGDEVETEEFGFTAPEGWRDVTDQIEGFDPVVAYAEQPEAGADFAANINVLRFTDGGQALDDLMDSAQTELEGAGYTEIAEQDPAQVDGEESGVIAAATSMNGIDYRTYQYLALHDGGRYVMTFSFPSDTSLDDQAALSRGVMSTWSWAS